MTDEQKAAYVFAQGVAALAEIAGMTAENMQREHIGEAMAFTHGDYLAVIEKYGVHNNAIISLFHGNP